jgi:hypothetical protein
MWLVNKNNFYYELRKIKQEANLRLKSIKRKLPHKIFLFNELILYYTILNKLIEERCTKDEHFKSIYKEYVFSKKLCYSVFFVVVFIFTIVFLN